MYFLTWSKTQSTIACLKKILQTLLGLLMLAAPTAVQAQFTITTNNGTITVSDYIGPGGDVTIPAFINNTPVTAIGASTFYAVTNLTSVTVPSTVTTVGAFAALSIGGSSW